MPNPVSAVGSFKNLMNIVKEVDFDDIRDRAEQAPRILCIAATEDAARAAGESMFGPQIDRFVEFRAATDLVELDPARYDIVLVTDSTQQDVANRVRRLAAGYRTSNVFSRSANTPELDEQLRLRIASALPDLAPSLGRWFEPFRPVAVKVIVDETSRANAQFAVVSNLPAVVPVLGSMFAAGADLIVLTKNQIMMAYKLAAASNRDLADHTGIIRELVPVVGAGFLWRSVAREAASFIPFAAGTIPKAVIAFAGTYTIGRAVDYYYRFGKKSSSDQMKLLWEEALALAARIPLPGRDQNELDRDAIEVTGEVRDSSSEVTGPIVPTEQTQKASSARE
ncbi:MAG TPA: hypothetical protein VD767_05290 [Thermomicrobiales bacterium]|nr:hypothetical protein [Thermomicrobiales bacterium]